MLRRKTTELFYINICTVYIFSNLLKFKISISFQESVTVCLVIQGTTAPSVSHPQVTHIAQPMKVCTSELGIRVMNRVNASQRQWHKDENLHLTFCRVYKNDLFQMTRQNEKRCQEFLTFKRFGGLTLSHPRNASHLHFSSPVYCLLSLVSWLFLTIFRLSSPISRFSLSSLVFCLLSPISCLCLRLPSPITCLPPLLTPLPSSPFYTLQYLLYETQLAGGGGESLIARRGGMGLRVCAGVVASFNSWIYMPRKYFVGWIWKNMTRDANMRTK